MGLILELVAYFRARRKFWLIPLVIACVAVGGLLILAKGSVLAPFIYTLF